MPGRFLVDISPLRESRDFRLLILGQQVATLGGQLTVVAIPYQVYSQTHSSFQVGAVSLAELIPLILGVLISGVVGDSVDRRTLLIVSVFVLALTSGGLAFNSLARHPSLVLIYVISATAAGITGFESTTWSSVIPLLIDKRLIAPAYAFVQILQQVGAVVGPAVAGFLIGAVHLWWVYGVDGLTAMFCLATAVLMAPIPPLHDAGPPGLESFREGVRFLRSRQVLQGVFLIDINAMVFGMPRALFPALASRVFGGGPRVLGFLYAAPGAGAFIGAVTTGWVTRVRHQAWVVIIAVAAWGAAITAFGWSRVLLVSLALLFVAGWADVVSAVLRSTILHTTVSEEQRSRMSSVQMAVVQGGPRLGDLEAGGVATAFGNTTSIVSGGLACIAGAALLAVVLPGFRRYRAGESEPAGAT